MRTTDLLLAFPGILLALAVIAILDPGLSNVMIAVGVSAIPSYTRVARTVYVLVNLVVDLLYGVIDPRIVVDR